jgi:hypothetical protein
VSRALERLFDYEGGKSSSWKSILEIMFRSFTVQDNKFSRKSPLPSALGRGYEGAQLGSTSGHCFLEKG